MSMKTGRLVILSQFQLEKNQAQIPIISLTGLNFLWNSTSNLRLTKPTISEHSDCASSSQSRRREASSKAAIGTILTCPEGHLTLPTWFPGLFPSRPFHFVWEKALGTSLLTLPLGPKCLKTFQWLFFKRRHYLDDEKREQFLTLKRR